MEIRKPQNWNQFLEVIEEIRQNYGKHKFGEIEEQNRILFRGQSNSSWYLTTTLERKSDEEFHILKYVKYASEHVAEIETFTKYDWNIPGYDQLKEELEGHQDSFRAYLPCYNFLVYLRHQGFPSPLMDWTVSPFIAAYFAYVSASKNNPTVYCFIEKPRGHKSAFEGEPIITLYGPYVKTHHRHFAQKASYTICTRWKSEEQRHYFCSHELVYDQNKQHQDVLIKIELPIEKRVNALQYLNDYNINNFTLFQSEDSLIKTIETRVFDLR